MADAQVKVFKKIKIIFTFLVLKETDTEEADHVIKVGIIMVQEEEKIRGIDIAEEGNVEQKPVSVST